MNKVIMVTTCEARENFSELVNQAVYGENKVIMTRRGKKMVTIKKYHEDDDKDSEHNSPDV